MAAIGWYGPLIDLSKASAYISNYVQILVYVHSFKPVQDKLISRGGEVIRTDIQVGDETRSFFNVCLWQKGMGSNVSAGDIILLQNVKITKYGEVVEARTVQFSSLLHLVHSSELLVSKDDELIMSCQVGITTKEKLRRVIEWSKQAGSSVLRSRMCIHQGMKELPRNWKVPKEKTSCRCLSVSDLSHLTASCTATFYASIGEMFVPHMFKSIGEPQIDRMFISRSLVNNQAISVAEDLICTGCQICGSPLESEHGSLLQKSFVPLYCPQSSDRLHVVDFIYRPFMLYLWDAMAYIPVLVRNKAAEILFGNIKAERVYASYKQQQEEKVKLRSCTQNHQNAEERPVPDMSKIEKLKHHKVFNLFGIWLILLKVLLQQGKNGPLAFTVLVNPDMEMDDGKLEMVSVSLQPIKSQVNP